MAAQSNEYSGPATAPEMRFIAPPTIPKPPKSALELTPEQQHYYDDEVSWGRWPRIIGIVSMIVGAAAAGVFFIPDITSYSLIVASAGALLAIIAIILSMRQEWAGIGWPIFGMLFSAVAAGLPWILPQITGNIPPPPSIHPHVADQKEADIELQRRAFLSVDTVKLAKGTGITVSDVEFTLTNKGTKPIAKITGSLRFYDLDHKLIGSLSLEMGFGQTPLPPGRSVTERRTWTLDPAVHDALADNRATADYRAAIVVFADGSTADFSH
jgi:hypothetical protein